MPNLSPRIVLLPALMFALAACDGGTAPFDGGPMDSVSNGDSNGESGSNDATDTASTVPVLLAVEPDHGPFSGGTSVTLRGSNLTADLVVTFGGALVQPRYESLTDSHRLVVATPAGNPGMVDVTIANAAGTQMSTVRQGYTYDSFYADPSTGSEAGGTLITLHGQDTGWTASTTVTVDSTACTNVTLVGPAEITCNVPAHTPGSVPITVTTGTEATTVPDAFLYYDGADISGGGFGGGHIMGNLDVTVLDLLTGAPIPGAFAYVGTDPTIPPPLSGMTDMNGEVTLASPTLVGPVTVTAAAHCYATSTFISEDGTDANIELIPWLGMVAGVDCGPPSPPGPPPASIYAAQVSGELVWSGPNEFGPNPWFNVPAPLPTEHRVAYVFTTEANIFSPNPDPGMGGTVQDYIPPMYGGRGYAYTIVARPAALAVYAVAGLASNDPANPQFVPYVLGVARSVLTSPMASITDVDIDMTIPLDHATTVTLHDLPPQDTAGLPNAFTVEGWTDLGGEGVIPWPNVTATGEDPTAPYTLVAQPAFDGTIADARMIVRATYSNGTSEQDPQSVVVVSGIASPDDSVDVANWVGIAQLVNPMNGGTIPADRTLTLGLNGANPDFFWSVISVEGSSCRIGFYIGDVVFWQHYFPGTNRTMNIPDISSIPGLTDMPSGLYNLSICGVHVPDFDYDNFTYQYLSEFYWAAYSSNTFTIAR